MKMRNWKTAAIGSSIIVIAGSARREISEGANTNKSGIGKSRIFLRRR